jgi:hypothetical protein
VKIKGGSYRTVPCFAWLRAAGRPTSVPGGAACTSPGDGDRNRLLAALASLRADGPAWTYAAPEAGYVPDPDPRALPDWLDGSAAGPAAPCGG